jgi:diguanylate cyclase (GGDEF)-like protein
VNRAEDFIEEKVPPRGLPWRKIIWQVLSLCLVVSLGLLDYLTGRELAFFQFYLIPVVLSGWFAGRWAAIFVAVISTLTWGVVDTWKGNPYSNPGIAYWNAISRMIIFLLAAFVIAGNRRRLEQQTLLARVDALTHASNSRYFLELIQDAIKHSQQNARPFTLIYIDLDNFKKVNDNLGHSTGDAALAKIVRIMSNNIRDADQIGRMGGDEFAILLENTAEAAAHAALERLHPALKAEMVAQGWPITFSMGVLTCTNVLCSAEEALKQADNLMYKVKLSTKDGAAFGTLAHS